MNNKWMTVVFALFLAAHAAKAQVPSGFEVSPDIGLAVQFDYPGVGDFDLYDYGITAEVQFRDWVREPWGYVLTLGYGDWAVNKDASEPADNLYDYRGSMEVVPFGGAVLLRALTRDDWSIVLDAGLRYMALDSHIKARNVDDETNRKYGLDIDDSLMFTGGATADYALRDNLIFSLGAGYRFDLNSGDINADYGTVQENVMESFYIETALRMPL